MNITDTKFYKESMKEKPISKAELSKNITKLSKAFQKEQTTSSKQILNLEEPKTVFVPPSNKIDFKKFQDELAKDRKNKVWYDHYLTFLSAFLGITIALISSYYFNF